MTAWRRVAGVVAAAALAALAPPVEAKVFDLHAGVRAGGVTGWGGAPRGAAFGFELGAELLLVDVAVGFSQVVDGAGFGGTITHGLIGFDGDFALDGRRRPRTFLRAGVAGGFGIVTRSPVDPPLDEAQAAYWGPLFQGTLALEQHLGAYLVAGFELVGGGHYFFPGGEATVNEGANAGGGQFAALFTFRAHFEPFRR